MYSGVHWDELERGVAEARDQLEITVKVQVRDGGALGCGNIPCIFTSISIPDRCKEGGKPHLTGYATG